MSVRITGRVRHYLANWKQLTNDSFILECIKGYVIPLDSKPILQSSKLEPNLSQQELIACESEISKLLIKGAISRCNPCKNKFVSSYFLIEKPNGDMRFILNHKN